MSFKTFPVVLSSNTKVYGNTTNKFKVRLPRRLQFGGTWHCALHSISYPYSWPALGAGDDQHIEVFYTDGDSLKIPVASGSHLSYDSLASALAAALQTFSAPETGVNANKTKKARTEESVRASSAKSIEITYHSDTSRFKVSFDDTHLKHICFSGQLGYVLGFSENKKVTNHEMATFPPDLRGGIAHIAVYSNVSEPVIMSDTMASLLRVVTVRGKPGENVEEMFDSPLYCKVASREITDIEIDLRTLDNRPIPFAYGMVVCTLLFKKAAVL